MPTRETPVVVSLVGPSGAGKTTLAAALVRRWSAAGLPVGYVKHASHGFQMDRPGKDTDRVAGAGAAGVAVSGPGGTAYLERVESRDPEAMVARFFPDARVVVVEGFREAGLPAVVLTGDSDPAAALACAGRAPVFDRDDIVGLAARVEASLGVRAPGARTPWRGD